MKSSGVGGGGALAENLGRIPENPDKNGTQRCLT